MSEFDDFNAGGDSVPSFKFDKIGATVKGTVLEVEKRQRRSLDGDPETWDDGNPKMQWVLTLQTELRDPDIEDDEGKRRIYAKQPSDLLRAIREAAKKGGGLKPHGTLAVKYHADGEPPKRGFNAPKLFRAQYEAPAFGLEADEEEPF